MFIASPTGHGLIFVNDTCVFVARCNFARNLAEIALGIADSENTGFMARKVLGDEAAGNEPTLKKDTPLPKKTTGRFTC
jgi:hypothetical protein